MNSLKKRLPKDGKKQEKADFPGKRVDVFYTRGHKKEVRGNSLTAIWMLSDLLLPASLNISGGLQRAENDV